MSLCECYLMALIIVILGEEGFYNIAHMTNNKESVKWAMEQGANAVEVDLQFRDDGTPYQFFHSSICDCVCMCAL